MYKLMHKMTILALAALLFLTACGPSGADREATAAAQTLEAESLRETAVMQSLLYITQTAAAMPPTETPLPPPPTAPPEDIPTQAAITPGVAPTLSQLTIPTNPPPTGNNLATLASETIPDGTIMKPGQSFTKTWKLLNAGTSTWSTEFVLVFVTGRQMSAPSEVYLPVPVAPGTLVDISVPMIAPSTVGTYQGDWKLRDTNGQTFGVGSDGTGTIWVKIVVSVDPTLPS